MVNENGELGVAVTLTDAGRTVHVADGIADWQFSVIVHPIEAAGYKSRRRDSGIVPV